MVTQFNNAGTFTKSVGTGTTTIGAAFDNSRTVNLNSGSISFTNSFTQTAGSTLIAGSLSSSQTLDIQGGILGGAGTITGNVSVTTGGQASPGTSPGVLAITGNYTQTATGIFAVNIDGPTAGTQFDQVTITGSATLGGTLNITKDSGFNPSLGDQFQVMTFASRTGVFATVNSPAFSGLKFTPIYSATDVKLQVIAATADLAVTKTVDKALPNEGDTAIYTVTVTNNGPDTTTGVQVTDLLPTSVSFVSASPSGSTTLTSGTAVWTVGSLADDASAALTITATVDSGTAGSTITNTASLTASEPTDANNANNSASAPITVQSADLAVTKTVDNAGPKEGDTIVYTVTVTNNGPDAATGVAVTDLLPSDVTFASATPTGTTTYNNVSGLWSVGNLAASASQTLTINAIVDSGTAGSTITNTATVTAADQADANNANNSASDGGLTVNDVAPSSTADDDDDDGAVAPIEIKVPFKIKLKGDYNEDGRITARDAFAALKMSLGELPEDLNLDMDGDGRVTVEDARQLLVAALAALVGT